MHLRDRNAAAAAAAWTSKMSGVAVDPILLATSKQKPIDKRRMTKICCLHLVFAPSQRNGRSPVSVARQSQSKRNKQIKKYESLCAHFSAESMKKIIYCFDHVQQKTHVFTWTLRPRTVFGIYKVINLFAIPIQAVFRLFCSFCCTAKRCFVFLLANDVFRRLISITAFIAVHRTNRRKRRSRDTQ